MEQESPLFVVTFKLRGAERDPDTSRILQFPQRSTNLHTRNTLKNDSNIKRYRSRNSFIMARHHMSSILSSFLNQSQISRTMSELWKNRNPAFDAYYKYLASLEACYLENFSIRYTPPTALPQSYRKLCASSYCATSSRQTNGFKVLKFKAKRVMMPMYSNNEICGLRVEDILKCE